MWTYNRITADDPDKWYLEAETVADELSDIAGNLLTTHAYIDDLVQQIAEASSGVRDGQWHMLRSLAYSYMSTARRVIDQIEDVDRLIHRLPYDRG
ncbi:hypothetical protein [Dietzia cinnamea]|uniref:hypothetical protein n=1 Tax=Dietzia cinnamea TaxID=321318 RepID=UPI00223A6A2B|nr:hypothetical protein [Dietzia cinnamea]MCT2077450.1 hypothetical protein [Dietzia cinnamea]MCT2221309.1 hypothetical protein [Dietzia cinnamea]